MIAIPPTFLLTALTQKSRLLSWWATRLSLLFLRANSMTHPHCYVVQAANISRKYPVRRVV